MDVTIKTALISVSDKRGVVDFAKALAQMGVKIISTGGTAKALAQAGVAVTNIDAVTGFPEMMDGRVKTLHPKIHGGLLALRDKPEHVEAMRQHGISPIDLVCVNLYPFEQTVANPNCTLEEAIENIDIGGPSMIRSAAKNHKFVTVVTNPDQYPRVIEQMRANSGAVGGRLREEFARAAFGLTAAYDAAIAKYLNGQAGIEFPDRIALALTKETGLRYGENPHQTAALYKLPRSTEPSVCNGKLMVGRHGDQLQQPARRQRRVRAGQGIRGAGRRGRQAPQPLRLRHRRGHQRRLSQGV